MKKFKAVILSEAQDDLKDAIDHYKKIDILLAKRFLKAAKTTVNDLKKMPLFQIKYDQIRLRIIHKFPYTIHYTVNIDNETIYIYGIRYASSDPKTWPKE
jgi:plasmid stabilization system protein ParE